MEREKRNKLFKLGLPIILGTILLIGVSYAWLTLTLNGTKTNVLKAGSLSLTLTDTATNGINMTGAVPMLDEVGVTTDPYTFTLTNNGTIESEYTIYLDDVALETNETRIADSAIKYNLVKDDVSVKTELLSSTGNNPNRVLETGVIPAGESYEYDLRLWIDQNATTAINGKVFRGTIRVEASQIIEEAPLVPTAESCFETSDNSDGTVTLTKYICGPYIFDEGPMLGVEKTNEVNDITDVVIPETINGKTVTKIKHDDNSLTGYAFEDTGITSVVIPNTITRIPRNAFLSNPELTSVVLPETLTSIGHSAFDGNQLTSLTIPSSVTTIGDRAFNRNQLTSVTVKGKSSISDFTSYGTNVFGWAEGYSDTNIIWER